MMTEMIDVVSMMMVFEKKEILVMLNLKHSGTPCRTEESSVKNEKSDDNCDSVTSKSLL